MTEINKGFLISLTLHFLLFFSLSVISERSSKIYYIPIQVIGSIGTGGGSGTGGDIISEGTGASDNIKSDVQDTLKNDIIKPGDIIAAKPTSQKNKTKDKIKKASNTSTNLGQGTSSVAGTGSGTGIGSGIGSGTGIGVDAGNFPYVGYINILRNKVAQNWNPQAYSSGNIKKVLVYFKIGKNGKIENLVIKESAGISYIDRSAIRAITNSSPFPPLPAGFPDNFLGVYFMFQLSGG